MSTLEAFKEDISQIDAIIDTNIITDNNTEYVQVIWPHNPAENTIDIHHVHDNYESIVQVSPSDSLRENNPDDESKFTQYFTMN